MITSVWHQLLVSILRWHVILYVLNIIRFLFKFKFAIAEIIERVIGLLETAADCTIYLACETRVALYPVIK